MIDLSYRDKKKIAVLTYNAPHRKTYDIACLLKTKGYDDVIIIGIDYHYEKKFKPIVEHRPSVSNNISPVNLASSLGFNFQTYHSLSDLDYSKFIDYIFLIGGAGIIPEKLARCCKILNSHPGILPLVRGLDALKWALWEDKPIGVTVHLVSEKPDSGTIIAQQQLEMDPFDNIQSIGARLYDLEIKLLVDSVEVLNSVTKGQMPAISDDISIVHKRMPKKIEIALLRKIIDRQYTYLREVEKDEDQI